MNTNDSVQDNPGRTAGEAGWRISRYNLYAEIPGTAMIAVANLFKGMCSEFTLLEMDLLSVVEMLDENRSVDMSGCATMRCFTDRYLETNARRAAPPFDYDHSFGFLSVDIPLELICGNPGLTALYCAMRFSGFDPSWDWSWYDPHALEGFESHIVEVYSRNEALPSDFGETVAWLFAIQREYVNRVTA